MEITKGENANLAGMEPRCPKCSYGDLDIESSAVHACYVECSNCGFDAEIEKMADMAQFFRSPAPTPPLDVEAAAQEINEDEITRIRTGRSRLTEKGIADILRRHIASPAQPEKRDEWVSVDERLPKADSQVPELSERVDFFAPGMIGERRFQRGRIKYGHCWRSATGDGEFDLAEVTHWQPLPAPPQSGKEGQS